MAAIDYASIAKDAKQAIADAGQQLILRRTGGAPVFDPVEGEYSAPGAAVDYTFRGVVLPSMPMWPSGRSTDSMEPSDQFVLMEPGVIEPMRTDFIVIDGGLFKVVDLERLAPAGVPVLYTLQIRM
jgi:hypothetical protein